jgi:hypothetical protein
MIYVYHEDDYYDNGGVGLEKFETRQLAADWITERMKLQAQRVAGGVARYTVIDGTELHIVPKRVVEVIELQDSKP